MQIIDSVEIHRFRSISDSTFTAKEITIFSGTNNSGKSNILRALNLFFNAETSFNHPFDFARDYNLAFTGQAGGQRIIKITIHFPGQGNGALSSPFSISRTFNNAGNNQYDYYSSNRTVQARLDKNDGNITRQYTRFLNKIVYFYVPAVRDRDFVQSLFLNFEQLIDNDEGEDFDKSIQDLSTILAKKSEDISTDFKSFIGLSAEAALSSRKTDILGAVEVNVDSGIEVLRRIKGITGAEKVKVNLFSSGDGILMSYLAYFIAHICKKLTTKRYVWGFEEPENSLEYSKVQKLAKDFTNTFVNDAQIFITTHSPAFINLKDNENNILYRVYIRPGDKKRSTEIRTLENLEKLQQSLFRTSAFSIEYEAIEKELGLVEFALEVEKTLDNLISQKLSYKRKNEAFESANQQILAAKPEKIFICEDSKPNSIQFWENLMVEFGMTNVKVISSEGSASNFVENGVVYQQTFDSGYKPRVFRQVDKDGLLDNQIQKIQLKFFDRYKAKFSYMYMPLPVNEIENFAVVVNGLFDDKFWLTHSSIITEAFEKTADALIKKFDKLFDHDESAGFTRSGTGVTIMQDMRRHAQFEWKKYMPGKTIASKLTDFNPLDYLTRLENDALPDELKSYMEAVKQFFD